MSINISKISGDIADLKAKKNTLLLSLQNDVNLVKKELEALFKQIGESAYNAFKEEKGFELLNELFERVDEKFKQIEAKDKKKAEISERYDEEIDIMQKLLDAEQKTLDVNPDITAFCAACGSKYTPGEHRFCINCGASLA